MRRFTLLLLPAIAVIAVFTGCSSEPAGPAGTATEIADRIFAESGVESFGPTQSLESDDDKEFYLGSSEYPEFADAAVVLPLISIDTRVLYVIRSADSGDVSKIMEDLEVNIDPDHLICVTFALEDVVIDSRGDVVFMTINSNPEQRAALADAFKAIS